jgi:hypothetical protein
MYFRFRQYRKQERSHFLSFRPGFSARNLLAAGGETADSSRDETALRNEKRLEFNLENRSSEVG